MDLKDEYALSFYEQIRTLDAQQGISLVRHTETGEFFVCKHLAASDCDVAVYRALQHSRLPGIPLIYELVEDDGELIIIEEFFQGQPLQELFQIEAAPTDAAPSRSDFISGYRLPLAGRPLTLRTETPPNVNDDVLVSEDVLPGQRPFSEDQAINLVLQLAGVVQSLHHMNPPIIHGNLLPSNVVVSPDGELKLYDFRAARFAAQEAAVSTNFNREEDRQCRQTNPDTATDMASDSASVHKDIQAIGEILRFLLANMSHSEKTVDKELASIVAKCSGMDEAGRYEDISELIADLHEIPHRNIEPDDNGNNTDNGIGNSNSKTAAFNKSSSSHENDSSRAASADPEQPWRRFLPPGFRSGKLVNMAAATTVYGFLILILYLEIRYGSDDPVIFGTLMISFLVIILFTADYVGVQSHLPLTRSDKTAVRVFGILLYNTLILVAAMVIAAALYTVVHT
ncbi:MAG: hypothetical protein LUG99_11850 [Lachnospiraceae bacterium]|nr:hypothetical protein [Lachnospiraceae bacterium]